jgi:SAM-dependent methyltransferase
MTEITAAEQYDAWFEANEPLFESEVRAIETVLPEEYEKAVEIGCGSGLFADRLGITRGVEPSTPMAERARERGLTVEPGTAEDLPLERDCVDLALALGVLGYVDDLDRAFAELGRVVEPGGRVVVAFLPAGRTFANLYDEAVARGEYPPDLDWETPYPIEMATAANWQSAEEVLDGLRSVGFIDPTTVQTLTATPETAVRSVESPTPGHDKGSWVVVRATRTETVTN